MRINLLAQSSLKSRIQLKKLRGGRSCKIWVSNFCKIIEREDRYKIRTSVLQRVITWQVRARILILTLRVKLAIRITIKSFRIIQLREPKTSMLTIRYRMKTYL